MGLLLRIQPTFEPPSPVEGRFGSSVPANQWRHRRLLTKLDVLDSFERLKLCMGYMLDGRLIDHLPARLCDAMRAIPVYEEMEGWLSSTQSVREWAQLPPAAVRYVRRIEELVGVPMALVSTSPRRDDTIILRDPFDANLAISAR